MNRPVLTISNIDMGRYVPPDQEGAVSANRLAGKHPLGSRARHLQTTGAITVRFEMPFPVWCHTCKPPSSCSSTNKTDVGERTEDEDYVLIGQGVRFNAEKKKVGNYYSTPIWSFRMKHSVCGGWIEIRTDPKNAEYVVVQGGRRRAQPAESEGEGALGLWVEEGQVGEIKLGKDGEKEDEPDPFAKLETKVRDERGFMSAQTRMQELRKRQERDWADPYENSRKLRRVFRAERKAREDVLGKTEAIKDKMSLGIELLDESEGDRMRAGLVQFGKDSGDTSVSRRGLFESSTGKTGSENAKKKPKKKTAADVALERKSLLQKQLSGNTRAAIDPFLSDERVWQPGFSVKRKSDSKSRTSTASSNTPEASREPKGSEFPKNEGNDKPPDSTKTGHLHLKALVQYGSDSN